MRGPLQIIGWFLGSICFGLLVSCSSDEPGNDYAATPLPLEVPAIFEQFLLPPIVPADNPQTVEGVALGRKLFFDPILSGDKTMSCANCHSPQNAFTDDAQFSIGIDGIAGFRNSMPIQNIAWNYNEKFFWDGRAITVEKQVFDPVTNPVEMHNTWPHAVSDLQASAEYPELFQKAFGTATIDSSLVAKAIAQFERTLISGNAPFDRYLMGDVSAVSQAEINGFQIFMDEARGDCFHCHGNDSNPLWTDNIFHNNGLDEIITDKGLGGVTGDPRQDGLFKSPSLRNLAYTAPYMHDGRFATLDEVIDHYSEGLVYSETIDPLMKSVGEGGVHLTEDDKADLKAFLLSLSEPGFVNNPNFQAPD